MLRRLRFNDLYAKAEKEQSSIKYLGIIIWENKVQMDEGRVKGRLCYPYPHSYPYSEGIPHP